jgi:hypothetical protein
MGHQSLQLTCPPQSRQRLHRCSRQLRHRGQDVTTSRNQNAPALRSHSFGSSRREGQGPPQLQGTDCAFHRPWEPKFANTVTQGHLDTYRFCDEVWTFIIKDINFKLDNAVNLQSDRIKIVAMNAKKPGEA